jgi:SAM-dependent methyltransferase
MLKWLESLGRHDELYDNDYYQRIIDPAAQSSAPIIAATVVSQFSPASIVDVGCGSGAILSAFDALRIRAFGIDYAKAAVDLCRARGLDVERFDIESGEAFTRAADVVLSTEVAEHLPERLADLYVSTLIQIAPVVIITAATPGQGGTDHVNEQPNNYWIDKFQRRSYSYLNDVSSAWRAEWAARGVAPTYFRNLMVFRRCIGPRPPAIPTFSA